MQTYGSSPVPAYRCCKMESACGVSCMLTHSKPGVVDLDLLHQLDVHRTNPRYVYSIHLTLTKQQSLGSLEQLIYRMVALEH